MPQLGTLRELTAKHETANISMTAETGSARQAHAA
jgi:hypothetical protein